MLPECAEKWIVETTCIPDFAELHFLCGAADQLYLVQNDTAPYFSQTVSYIHTETKNSKIYLHIYTCQTTTSSFSIKDKNIFYKTFISIFLKFIAELEKRKQFKIIKKATCHYNPGRPTCTRKPRSGLFVCVSKS